MSARMNVMESITVQERGRAVSMDHIFIEGFRAEASVGIYPQELAQRQTIEIDLEIGMPANAGERDNIADTIDYDKVVQRINLLLAERHFNLLETLAACIADIVLSEFKAPSVQVSLAKLGVVAGTRRVGVLVRRSR